MPNPSTARRGRARHRSPSPVGFMRFVAAAAVVLVVAVAWRSGVLGSLIGSKGTSSSASSPSQARGAVTSAPATPSHPSHPPSTAAATPGPINTSFPGLTTFRGNATRDYYGAGPVPTHPTILWRYPRSGALCSSSNNLGVTKVWCGTGWTGQPNVIPHKDGTIEVREGTYDGHYHFLNGLTGEQLRPDLVTGDLAKGSATSDSQGYPLYYGGSRDNLLRVVALDRAKPTVLWSYNSRSNPHLVWNDDWDAAPLEVGDYLMEGSENSWFYIWKLNRRYDANGLVQVDPQLMMEVPGYDSQLFASIHDQDVSIENSVAYDAARGVVYFANSGGLVQGWDVRDVLAGHPYVPGTDVYHGRVFRFWDGDDTDASIVIDQQGDLIVGRKMEENVHRPSAFPRDHQIGDLMKLDPTRPDPVVWSVQLGGFDPDGGILGTPALSGRVVYAPFTEGGFGAVSAATGRLMWTVHFHSFSWGSPVPVDGVLLLGDCTGLLHAYDISHPFAGPPKELWHVDLGGCIESTPAVWHGMVYVGSRAGAIYGIGDPKKA